MQRPVGAPHWMRHSMIASCSLAQRSHAAVCELVMCVCRFTSPSPDGLTALPKASPRARNSDLGTTRSRLARGQSSGYAVRRGTSELHSHD